MENNRNRQGEKGSDSENRTGERNKEYMKLPDDQINNPSESVSTRDDTANGKYSRTDVRDEDIDNDDTRGGR